jgi:peptidoglycan hydrolase-like protein with peptidoglycan-binding domain
MVLRQGATGPVVRAVQQAVGATVDGSFGTATAAALSTWQAAHGVRRTGVVDAATWRALIAPPVIVAGGGGTVAHPELTRYRTVVLKRGSKGAAVYALQRRLAMPHPLGVFGVKTQDRVLAFQKAYRLAVTGVVTKPTWVALGA